MKNYSRTNKGFTFLELLAAILIMSVALVPILSWVPVSLQTKRKAENKMIAIFLAQSKLEELRLAVLNNFSADYDAANVAFTSPYQDFRYTITDNANTNLKTVSIRVWNKNEPSDKVIFYTRLAPR